MNQDVERVTAVLAALIKAALVSDDHASLAHRQEAGAGLEGLRSAPPDPAHLRVDGAWTLAVRAAQAPDLQPGQGQVSLTLPQASPLGLDDLLAPDFDVDRAVERIRKAAATG